MKADIIPLSPTSAERFWNDCPAPRSPSPPVAPRPSDGRTAPSAWCWSVPSTGRSTVRVGQGGAEPIGHSGGDDQCEVARRGAEGSIRPALPQDGPRPPCLPLGECVRTSAALLLRRGG